MQHQANAHRQKVADSSAATFQGDLEDGNNVPVPEILSESMEIQFKPFSLDDIEEKEFLVSQMLHPQPQNVDATESKIEEPVKTHPKESSVVPETGIADLDEELKSILSLPQNDKILSKIDIAIDEAEKVTEESHSHITDVVKPMLDSESVKDTEVPCELEIIGEPSTVTSDNKSVDETIVLESITSEKSVVEAIVLERATSEKPVVEAIVLETATSQKPEVEAIVLESATSEKPVVEAIVLESATSEKPVVEAIVLESATSEKPVAEAIVLESATSEKPVVEAIVLETVEKVLVIRKACG